MKILVILLELLTVVSIGLSNSSDFAVAVVSSQGPFGAYPYNEPNAVLGRPTTDVYDSWERQIFKTSLVYPAWNVFPDSKPTILTLGPNSEVVLGFDHNVADDINNPYGIDLIVFSNTFFQRQGVDLTPTTDMSTVFLTTPASVNDQWVTVSVAQDPNGPWFAFPADWATAGALFPTNPYSWDSRTKQWAGQQDFLKPVDPNLTLADFSGLSVPDAITLYDGSAGGTGFDLEWLSQKEYDALRIDPETGRRWIKYIKLTSNESGKVDAVSDVAACGDYKHPFPLGDINRDCRVNLADFSILAENWLVCTWNCGT